MRIGFDARMIDWSGIGTYSRRVIEKLAQREDIDLVLFVNPDEHGYQGPITGQAESIEVEARVFSITQTRWEKSLASAALDVFFTPYIIVPFDLPCPAAGTIHDMIPWRIPSVQKRLMAKLFYRQLIKKAAGKFNRIVVDSEYTRDDVERFLHVDSGIIHVIPAAADDDFRPRENGQLAAMAQKFGLNKPFFLNVGTARRHKNLKFLISAFARFLQESNEDIMLVFAGPESYDRTQHRRLAENLNLAGKVKFIGRVEQDELPLLYNLALAGIYPSLIEGFGLPALESMASGLPVICTNGSSLAEVVADAGLLIDPTDEGALVTAMRRLVQDKKLREQMVLSGIGRAQLYSWEKTASDILEAIKRTASNE